MYLSKLAHQPASALCFLMIVCQRVRVRLEERHRQVAGQDVVQRRDVGRALDRGVAAQRQDPAARPADVAEQQLQDRRGANDLHAFGVLRPSHGVTDRGGLRPARRRGRTPRPPSRNSLRGTPQTLDHFGRVAREVPLQHLEHAARMLQRRIGLVLRHLAGFAAAILAVTAACFGMAGVCRRWLLPGSLVQPGFRIVFLLVSSHPENSPPRSSVSRKSSRNDHRARSCSATTYSRNSLSFSRT